MIFSTTLRHWSGWSFSPRQIYRTIKKRSQFRQEIARMLDDPYLLDDVGFNRDAAAVEASRSPWQPSLNLRQSSQMLMR